jgi:hypothetical protein
MADVDPTIVIEDVALRRVLPFRRFEYVTVTFGAADTDHVIPYTILRPNDIQSIRWIDITPGTVYNGSSETAAVVYRSNKPDRMAWAPGYIVLRSTVADYSTRLLLFLERA